MLITLFRARLGVASTPPQATQPAPSPAAAQAAVDLIRQANPKTADAIQKTLDFAKAVDAARNRP